MELGFKLDIENKKVAKLLTIYSYYKIIAAKTSHNYKVAKL